MEQNSRFDKNNQMYSYVVALYGWVQDDELAIEISKEFNIPNDRAVKIATQVLKDMNVGD